MAASAARHRQRINCGPRGLPRRPGRARLSRRLTVSLVVCASRECAGPVRGAVHGCCGARGDGRRAVLAEVRKSSRWRSPWCRKTWPRSARRPRVQGCTATTATGRGERRPAQRRLNGTAGLGRRPGSTQPDRARHWHGQHGFGGPAGPLVALIEVVRRRQVDQACRDGTRTCGRRRAACATWPSSCGGRLRRPYWLACERHRGGAAPPSPIAAAHDLIPRHRVTFRVGAGRTAGGRAHRVWLSAALASFFAAFLAAAAGWSGVAARTSWLIPAT